MSGCYAWTFDLKGNVLSGTKSSETKNRNLEGLYLACNK